MQHLPHPYLLALLLALTMLTACHSPEPQVSASLAVAEAMGGDTTGYNRAIEVRDFVFPDDHGAHPGYKTEWWYYTGNVTSTEGRRYGYQFTLFRSALTPPTDTAGLGSTDSDWTTNQLFMGHFALTDIDGDAFYAYERFSRASAGLAGAQPEPFRVWLEDWSAEAAGPVDDPAQLPMRVRAYDEGTGLDLTLTPAKPMTLQGERGLDPKGAGVGNASYYFSYTRLATEGTMTVEGETVEVSGLSWMDREWSTSALDEGQVGWDWFALQLDDGSDLMYYQLRESDGSPSRFTNGVVVDEAGQRTTLTLDDVTLTVTDTWTSPDGGTYPAGWTLSAPTDNLDLVITPTVADQELDVSVRYWEGSVTITGTHNGQPVAGRGYVEMTGYGDAATRI
ncbi:MAG: lipocalin-like domain-containing protein [Bacteroidota bacterium]